MHPMQQTKELLEHAKRDSTALFRFNGFAVELLLVISD
jgi:hypothetical protein